MRRRRYALNVLRSQPPALPQREPDESSQASFTPHFGHRIVWTIDCGPGTQEAAAVHSIAFCSCGAYAGYSNGVRYGDESLPV